MSKANQELKGTVLEIQRMSTEDGPGIRTTVFMKGCSLSCEWCHNPESILMKPQLQWIDSRCIGCHICVATCEKGALTAGDAGIEINREKCEACGECVEECPSTAMELLGKEWTVAALADELAKDAAFFQKSGGGVTTSGGEATLQSKFIAALFQNLRDRGIPTALDTCGQTKWEALERILPHADLVLFDMKHIDPKRHKELTGSDNARILENLKATAAYVRDHLYPKALWIRTPIIPGATDNVSNIQGIGAFIAEHLDGVVERWDLCAFNNLCKDKYLRLDMQWAYQNTPLMTTEAMQEIAQAAKTSGVSQDIVVWSGSTKIPEGNGETGETTKRKQPKVSC